MVSLFEDFIVAKVDMISRIKLATSTLRFVGLWPTNFEYKLFDFYTIYFGFYFIFICIGPTLPKVINLFVVDTLEEFTASLFVGMVEIAGIYKMCLFIKNLPLAKRILETLNEELNQPRNELQLQILNKLFKRWVVMMSIFLFLGHTTIVLWALFPLMDQSNDRKLPFLAWYPVDSKQTPYYELIYIHQLLGISYYNLANVSLDGLFSGMMIFIAAECQFSCDNMRNIYDFTRERLLEQGVDLDNYQLTNELEEDSITDAYNDSLKIIVGHHQGILNLVKDTNILFTFTVTFQLCTTVLSLCTTMFQLSVVKPLTTEFYSLIFYQVALSWEVLMYCWSGNEAMFSSKQISLAAFESDWIKSSLKFKKNLVFFIRAAHKPIRLYALQFFSLSLETFINILRMSWSYFCLLRQVNQEN